MPQIPTSRRGEIHDAMRKAFNKEVPAAPVAPPARIYETVTGWHQRQVVKFFALACVITGVFLPPGDGRAFAVFVGVLFAIIEFLESRRAEKDKRSVGALLNSANALCLSMHSIAVREGKDTNWAAFRERLDEILSEQGLKVTSPPL